MIKHCYNIFINKINSNFIYLFIKFHNKTINKLKINKTSRFIYYY